MIPIDRLVDTKEAIPSPSFLAYVQGFSLFLDGKIQIIWEGEKLAVIVSLSLSDFQWEGINLEGECWINWRYSAWEGKFAPAYWCPNYCQLFS